MKNWKRKITVILGTLSEYCSKYEGKALHFLSLIKLNVT